MQDISGFGSLVTIAASRTFANIPFPITTFSDDADAFDFPDLQIGDGAKGVNGDLITWSKANPIKGSISVVVGSLDDIALQTILKNNTPSKGKSNAQDVITMTIIYPDATQVTFTQGKMISGMPGKSLASSGRLKTKVYNFMFETVIG